MERTALLDTFVSNTPTLLGLFIWLGITFLGWNYIQTLSYNEEIKPLVVIVWMIVCMGLYKIVPPAVTITHEEENNNGKHN